MVRPKLNDWCLYKWREIQGEDGNVKMELLEFKDQSYTSTSPGTPEATRSWKRQGRILP